MRSVFLTLLLVSSAAFALADVPPPQCPENQCHEDAFCALVGSTWECSCPDTHLGWGDGATGNEACQSTGWTRRYVFDDETEAVDFFNEAKVACVLNDGDVNSQDLDGCWVANMMNHTGLVQNVSETGPATSWSVNLLFKEKEDAEGYPGTEGTDLPYNIYAWDADQTGTEGPIAVPPSGFTVTSVVFNTSCAETGCWEISFNFTVGHRDVQVAGLPMGYNTFYLPYAPGSDELSYDYGYTPQILASYEPMNFPCRNDYDGSESEPTRSTMCCFENTDKDAKTVLLAASGDPAEGFSPEYTRGGFLGNYRASNSFVTYADSQDLCPGGNSSDPVTMAPDAATSYGFWAEGNQFDGMTASPGITKITPVDTYIGMYMGVIKLDEEELREKAGQLTGTVGVEYTVDTFLGLANFKPATGSMILDSLASQTNLHLEKTNFFTVSTNGQNDYTFLEYINLRLVTVLLQDSDNSGDNEATAKQVDTDENDQANYVQVTFTLGEKYTVDPDSPMIPDNSVRAGISTFFDDAVMEEKCVDYEKNLGKFSNGARRSRDEFDKRMDQDDCAPAATMCASPKALPDNFVSYNVPIGIDQFKDRESSTLDNNVFVDMVIFVLDPTCPGNSDTCARQMKTTLSASIPIVDGGVNIFCDGIAAKTDLKDVATAHIVVGSASSMSELSNLQILGNVSSGALQPSDEDIYEINTDSIESGLMTLVIEGDDSYFAGTNANRLGVSLELEDVITIHIMDSTGSGAGTDKDDFVKGLILGNTEDNQDASGLDTDGYKLNDAFFFTIDRDSQRAHLEPTAELLSECPFNPPRPAVGVSPIETCVTRRDVRYRDYPARTGGLSTAMEICAKENPQAGGRLGADELSFDVDRCPESDDQTSDEAMFFTTILGDSTGAREDGSNHARVIAEKFVLNGRYKRAFLINPGYEWTPTQTGGVSYFTISQKLYLFALVTLDEGIVTDNDGNTIVGEKLTLPATRRRMLLQTVDDNLKDAQSGVSAQEFKCDNCVEEFKTKRKDLMAGAFGVPTDKVATFTVELQLTQAEACMPVDQLQGAIRETLEDYMNGAATSFHTVQVVTLQVNQNKVECNRRTLRGLKAFSEATAVVTMLVVAKAGGQAGLSSAAFLKMPGVNSITASPDNSPKFNHNLPEGTTPAPESSSGSSNVNVALYAGIAGGVVAAIVLVVGLVFFMRSKKQAEPVTAVQTINVEDLKSQLAGEV